MSKADQFQQYARRSDTLGFPIQNRKREASLYRVGAHMDASCAAQRAHFRRQRQSARSQGSVRPAPVGGFPRFQHAQPNCTRSVCREAANGSLSRQGERVRSSDNSYKIAAGKPSILETRGNVLAARAGRRTRERSIFKNDRENEPDMTTYPLEFHRRSERKWILRAQASSARESIRRSATRASSNQTPRSKKTAIDSLAFAAEACRMSGA
jgi:hypothetical protein